MSLTTKRFALSLFFSCTIFVCLPELAAAQSQVFVDPAARPLPGGQGFIDGHTSTRYVAVRLRQGASAQALEALPGVEVVRVGGRPLAYADWVSVRVHRRGVRQLERSSAVAEVRVIPDGIPPLERSSQLIGLGRARGMRTDLYTGSGVLLSDLDSHVDVFHPDFFYGDAGYFDWIDVDGSGHFSPTIDAIDLDADGVLDAGEVAAALRASPVDLQMGGESPGIRAPGFDPRVDWLYLDQDGNGRRSYGAAAGFTDASLAFGEPLFVPDDVNQNGRLDPEERVVRLGTSKFRAVFVNIDFAGTTLIHEYVRGVDLITSPDDITGGIYGYADTLHATGVLGIAAGGVPLPSRRWVGIAPNAELTNAFEINGGAGGRLMWTYAQSPDVVLHEYVSWTRTPLDGSDAASALIDTSAAAGVANICPGGNIGAANKHTGATLADGVTAAETFQLADVRVVEITIHARGTGTLSVELEDPAGTTYPIGGVGWTTASLTGGGILWSISSTTPRGTQMRDVLFDMPSTAPGTWTLRLTSSGGALETHSMISDEGGFAVSSVWDDATPDSTIAWPATADRCLAVGSIPAHTMSEGAVYRADGVALGEVRTYSARGPRIDGVLRPHVLAPDNPWSTLGAGELYPTFPGGFYIAPHGAYQVFGGTSGAGPHVAGVAALLGESGLAGDAIGAAITGSADNVGIGGVPNNDYGFGRLRADAAVGAPLIGDPPSVTLTPDAPQIMPGESVRFVATVSSAALLRWDTNYDGTFEGDYGAVLETTLTFPLEGTYRVKVRARAAHGAIAEAAALVVVSSVVVMPDAGVPDAGTMLDSAVPPIDAGGTDSGLVAPSDAGTDAGVPGRDAGGTDGGMTGVDAEVVISDAGPPMDAGAVADAGDPIEDAGCSCRANASGDRNRGWLSVWVVGLFLTSLRRRR